MARKIKLKFYDKEYIIEYKNRSQVKEYFAELESVYQELKKLSKDADERQQADVSLKGLTVLVKAGLLEHHANEMPSDEDIDRWLTSIPNAEAFYQVLLSMVQEVVSVIKDDAKNLKWEVE